MVSDDLVFDIGMHLGEDTATYLAQGYRVVAFEANPDLVDVCRTRFASDIASGRLTIVSGAIGPAGSPNLKFFKNSADTQWSTIDPAWVARNDALGSGTVQAIDVPRVDMVEQFRTHGTPLYMKIDIEGADMIALAALREADSRPSFVSIESNKTSFAALREEFRVLRELGYDDFKLSQQYRATFEPVALSRLGGGTVLHSFEHGSSGAWGEDLPGEWLDARAALAAYRWAFLGYRLCGDNSPGQRLLGKRRLSYLSWRTGICLIGWFDTHARLAS